MELQLRQTAQCVFAPEAATDRDQRSRLQAGRYNRGRGVRRGLGKGPGLGVTLGRGVAVGVEETVAVGVAVGTGVDVAVGVGVGVSVGVGVAPCPCISNEPMSIRPLTTRLKPVPR
jgi:hypothetical protein